MKKQNHQFTGLKPFGEGKQWNWARKKNFDLKLIFCIFIRSKYVIKINMLCAYIMHVNRSSAIECSGNKDWLIGMHCVYAHIEICSEQWKYILQFEFIVHKMNKLYCVIPLKILVDRNGLFPWN